MPNWCSNNVTFEHTDPAMIQRVAKAYNENRLFSEFFPCPEDLKITAGTVGAADSPEQIELAAKEQANLEKYGYANWYDWQVNEWGTKWDVESVDEVEAEPNSVTVFFDSAWSPPIEFYNKMVGLGFNVQAYYYEPGMAFCGSYEDGNDTCFDITGNSDWVKENIPGDIDEIFAISENMEIWEEEEKDNG